MALCPVCNSKIPGQATTCPVCNTELDQDLDQLGEWLILGVFEDQVSAGLAHETLLNADIPAVLFSKAGFFGAAGLTMNTFYGNRQGMYEISVPTDMFEEANELVNAVLDGQWHPRTEQDPDEEDDDDDIETRIDDDADDFEEEDE